MAIIDLHSKEFDEATITKLELFEDYAKEWIPTFVMSNCTNLWIFDYFAGPGYDKNHIEGSPIRILRQVAAQIGNIFRKQTKINICFNEFDEEKYSLLQQHCNQFIVSHPELQRAIDINLLNIKSTELRKVNRLRQLLELPIIVKERKSLTLSYKCE